MLLNLSDVVFDPAMGVKDIAGTSSGPARIMANICVDKMPKITSNSLEVSIVSAPLVDVSNL